jgi:hypothetical protein
LRATVTSVRWPMTSRPSLIHDRRASSRRTLVASATAVARPAVRPGGSRVTRSVSERRARAARRRSRSATRAAVVPGSGRWGRSMTRRSTDRPASRAAAIDRPSSSVSGVRTTSQSSRTPRATASTGSSARARSSQATIAPSTWASAARRRARVVLPELASPRTATLALRGRPPGPRIASSAGKPVRTIRSTPWLPGSGESAGSGRSPGSGDSAGSASSGSTSSGSGTVARAPMTRGFEPGPSRPSRAIRGAAAPQRAWRDARAADTSGESAAIAQL